MRGIQSIELRLSFPDKREVRPNEKSERTWPHDSGAERRADQARKKAGGGPPPPLDESNMRIMRCSRRGASSMHRSAMASRGRHRSGRIRSHVLNRDFRGKAPWRPGKMHDLELTASPALANGGTMHLPPKRASRIPHPSLKKSLSILRTKFQQTFLQPLRDAICRARRKTRRNDKWVQLFGRTPFFCGYRRSNENDIENLNTKPALKYREFFRKSRAVSLIKS